MEIHEKAPAKINLSLKVFEKRADGYHRVESVMLKVSLFDDVSVEVSDGMGISVKVLNQPDLSGEHNLAFKAAKAYLDRTGVQKSISIKIYKRIFVAAGLGGGSSDAAAVLRALNNMIGKLSQNELANLACEIGSDVPFLLENGEIALAVGRGEELAFWPALPSRPILLMNPGFPVSTRDAYQALSRSLTSTDSNGNSHACTVGPKNWSDLHRLVEFRNDLQEGVEERYPKVREIRKLLTRLGAKVAQMSGSGATVFGLFDEEPEAQIAYEKINKNRKVVLTKTGISD